MKIYYTANTFQLSLPKHLNAEWFSAMGWFQGERGFESAYKFSTRSFFAVDMAVQFGYSLQKSALDAIKTRKDDPHWAAKMNARREALRKRREDKWKAKERARKALVESARAKLTPQEWGAILEASSMRELA